MPRYARVDSGTDNLYSLQSDKVVGKLAVPMKANTATSTSKNSQQYRQSLPPSPHIPQLVKPRFLFLSDFTPFFAMPR